MMCGILLSCYVIVGDVGVVEIDECFYDVYDDELFVCLFVEGELLQIKVMFVLNYCDVVWCYDEECGQFVVYLVIDNFCKGVVSQVVQNMNLFFSLLEIMGFDWLFVFI